jgi:carbon storage regulator
MEGTMLVLSRRLGETILIGDDVQITVVAIQGKKVRLAVSAPPYIAVDRQEVRERRVQFKDDEVGVS